MYSTILLAICPILYSDVIRCNFTIHSFICVILQAVVYHSYLMIASTNYHDRR
ncbi:hypothetical protein BDQ12DRAFT_687414 [Crucibulum laeve]|uniref:Uncharacterized protein n=1 Tax=Crucibulum laeve TaxID=68775 RepID=A0A5C3LT30_9AGAR|nr:hypothetical protein BDQ12DRAFT_687414 [Crucibulum laeve]